MKTLRFSLAFAAAAAIGAAATLTGCTSLFLQKAWPQTSGAMAGLPLGAPVTVTRDRWGIAHIAAGNEHDLLVAQGFVHAQDRLWQMESLRRLTDGRLAEIAGEKAAALDYFSRLVGLPSMKDQALAGLSTAERARLEAYAEGVNAYIKQRGKDLPLEFASMGFTPEPWAPRDSLSLVPFMSLSLCFPGYAEELFALARGGSFTEAEWNDIFPVAPHASLPPEQFFASLSKRKLGVLNPALFLMHVQLPKKYSADQGVKALLAMGSAGGGSNNWAVAKSATGLPLLANDPHLAIALPSVWYFCHLSVPGTLNVAGCSLAGAPGVVIGRNEHVAWGLTNVMLDAVDMLVYESDPADPTRYRAGSDWKSLEREDVVIRLGKGRSVTLPAWRTEEGPVVTGVQKGVEAVAAMKWYGTLPAGMLEDHIFRGAWAFMTSVSVAEVLEAGRDWAYISQNLVAADDRGSIGWHAVGAVPVRNGYSGRLPADGSNGATWTGFLPYDELPKMVDPPRGFLATANYQPEGWTGTPISYTWTAPYRWERIMQSLAAMSSPTVESFRALQADVHSLQADRLIPKVLSLRFTDPRAMAAAEILRSWDRTVTTDSRGAAVYEVFLARLGAAILGPRLGDDLALYLNTKMYGIEDEILDRPGSTLWDDPSTPARETPAEVVEKALGAALEYCRARMGGSSQRWTWGELHRYVFTHPGATNPLFANLLNRGPFAAPGDNNTVNVGWSVPFLDSFDTTTIPSMRMIASLADADGLWISGPLGQSGQPGSRHYDDLMALYAAGEQAQVPLTAEGVAKVAAETLTLTR